MNAQVFEEPSKSEMRAACEVAIDQAGFQLAPSLVKVTLPSHSGLKGTLIGDLQSLDASENRTFYFLRATPIESLPKWLANLARASHSVGAGDFYIVVREFPPSFKLSCISSGAGLLRLSDDNQFEVVVSYNEVSPADADAALTEKLDDLRRTMERKMELESARIEQLYHRVSQLVSTMPSAVADNYRTSVEQQYKTLETWSMEMSRQLDNVSSATLPAAFAALEESILAGPTIQEEA